MRIRTFNNDLHTAHHKLEQTVLARITTAYEHAIREAANQASERFALTASAKWQPPAEGALITLTFIRELTVALNQELIPLWAETILDTTRSALAAVEISWDVADPVPKKLIDAAAKRTGARLDEAVQFTLRDTIREAWDQGLNVRDTSALIQQRISDASTYQADMLARTDLNSLGNGASKEAARQAGMGFKTWLSALDDKTRPTHVDAHGQTVPVDSMFVVGGEDADYPGDPNLSDAESCNCRCSLAFGETLAEAEGLLADGTVIMMSGMATKDQRKRKYQRRAAHGKAKEVVLAGANGDAAVVIATNATNEATNPVRALVAATLSPVGFSGTALIEGKVSDDNTLTPRVIMPDSIAWPEMPVSFMAQTVTAEGHDGAEVAGRVDEFARKKSTGRMRDITLAGELTNEFGINEIAPMIADKTMRYVSADLGATEWAIVNRNTLAEVPEEDLSLEDLHAGVYALACTSGKMKAVTLLPTQAIEGALVALTASADDTGLGIEALAADEMFALVASGHWTAPDDRVIRVVMPLSTMRTGDDALVAAASTWVAPPREWFDMPELPGKMPLTVTKEGRVYGHLATWDSCHASFLPSCLPPPHSPSNYARFHTGELDTAEGDVVSVGKLMFSPTDGGHADRTLSAAKASQYYDRTGMAAAFLHATDGQYGIWVAGALNPRLDPEQREEMRRELRLNPPSGDWRIWDGQYDLLCGIAVAIPGFGIDRGAHATVTITASAEGVELSEAIIASSGLFEPDPRALFAAEQLGIADEDVVAERRMRILAARAEGLDALAALVD